jgi:hypothetical protein
LEEIGSEEEDWWVMGRYMGWVGEMMRWEG